MHFQSPVAFEIPDEWWGEAGMRGFAPRRRAYRAVLADGWPNELVPVSAIEPVHRAPGVRWFERERMVAVLRGFIEDSAMPPVEVYRPEGESAFRFLLRDGFHRFYASAAAGFECIPVVIMPPPFRFETE